MKVSATSLPGVLLIEPDRFGDDRGFFMELFNDERYAAHGVPARFVQDNVSRSRRGTLRGLHFQEPNCQGKLVQVLSGSVWDVAVDVRQGSATFGRWYGIELSAENALQLWIPPGFAHGFCVTSDTADFFYKCTERYAPGCERAILWNDPDLAIRWPIEAPLLSAKDQRAPRLRDVTLLPR